MFYTHLQNLKGTRGITYVVPGHVSEIGQKYINFVIPSEELLNEMVYVQVILGVYCEAAHVFN